MSFPPGRGHAVELAVCRLPQETLTLALSGRLAGGAGYFLWGSHTRFTRPADVFLHLVDGRVYENRRSWPHYHRIPSENDAHALCVVLAGLGAATGEPIHQLLREAVVDAVVRRQAADGGWYHGEWTDDNESHFRLHTSALHLLMDELERTDGPMLQGALERGVAFLAARTDALDAGTWFLHDSLEVSVESMRKSPFRWVPSRAFGKSPSNMLVLNTHLDTLVAFDRYRSLTGDRGYDDVIDSARESLRCVLAARPAEWLYHLIFASLGLTFLPTPDAKALPVWQRAVKRVGWKYLAPRLHHVKRVFPRLAMPGGYIDRALSLRGVGTAYQAVNMMDLVRYARRFPDEEDNVMTVLEPAFDLVVQRGLRRRWEEDVRTRYALGFWAETLYHLCLLKPHDARYRAWLADAMQRAEALDLGQAPSLLGGNGEAVPPTAQVPTPVPEDNELRVANLSTGTRREFLVVNPTANAKVLTWRRPPDAVLQWTVAGSTVPGAPSVPAGGWVWGREETQ